MPSDWKSESQPAQANYCRSIYSDHSGSKRPNGFERILAHRIGCQRARASCHAESTTNNLKSMPRPCRIVNTGLPANFSFPQTPCDVLMVLGRLLFLVDFGTYS